MAKVRAMLATSKTFQPPTSWRNAGFLRASNFWSIWIKVVTSQNLQLLSLFSSVAIMDTVLSSKTFLYEQSVSIKKWLITHITLSNMRWSCQGSVLYPSMKACVLLIISFTATFFSYFFHPSCFLSFFFSLWHFTNLLENLFSFSTVSLSSSAWPSISVLCTLTNLLKFFLIQAVNKISTVPDFCPRLIVLFLIWERILIGTLTSFNSHTILLSYSLIVSNPRPQAE